MAEIYPVSLRIVEAHKSYPFSVSESRKNAQRVIEICQELGVEAKPFRGHIDFGAASISHVWVEVPEVEAIYDLTLPMHSTDVQELLVEEIPEGERRLKLALAGMDLGVFARVLGDAPDGVRYRGNEFYGRILADPDRRKYHNN